MVATVRSILARRKGDCLEKATNLLESIAELAPDCKIPRIFFVEALLSLKRLVKNGMFSQ